VPLSSVTGSWDFCSGLFAMAGAGALMTMIMAIGPLSSHQCGYPAYQGAAIIQWHLIGMFAPAIVSGNVLAAIGPRGTGVIGAGLFGAGAISAVLGVTFSDFIIALTLNGVGWNFLFLSGKTFLTRSYPPGRGGRIQAVAEGLGQFTGVVASLTASSIFVLVGWQGINWAVLGISLVLMMCLLLTRPVAVAKGEPRAVCGPGSNR